jgi:hypothetical protein
MKSLYRWQVVLSIDCFVLVTQLKILCLKVFRSCGVTSLLVFVKINMKVIFLAMNFTFLKAVITSSIGKGRC